MTHEEVTWVLFYFCIFFTVTSTVIMVAVWKMTKYMYRIARVFEMLIRDTALMECPLVHGRRHTDKAAAFKDSCPIQGG